MKEELKIKFTKIILYSESKLWGNWIERTKDIHNEDFPGNGLTISIDGFKNGIYKRKLEPFTINESRNLSTSISHFGC